MDKYNGYIVCRAVWDTAVCIEELYAFVADRYSGHWFKPRQIAECTNSHAQGETCHGPADIGTCERAVATMFAVGCGRKSGTLRAAMSHTHGSLEG